MRLEVNARAEAQAVLHHAERLDALAKLVAGVSHEVNNAAAVALAGLRLLRKRHGEGLNTAAEGLLDSVEHAARRASGTTKRLLAFAQRDELEPESVSPADMMTTLAGGTLAGAMGKSAASLIVLPAAPSTPSFRADRAQLAAALTNLTTNARDAMPDGGTVTISLRSEMVGRGGSGCLSAGEYVRLDVTDTGSGMDAATLARAREPFFTTKPEGYGTGLGLSMVHGFAEQSGGAMRIRSVPGIGTTVSIYLPALPLPMSKPLQLPVELRELATTG